jgi:hypothetical protein
MVKLSDLKGIRPLYRIRVRYGILRTGQEPGVE